MKPLFAAALAAFLSGCAEPPAVVAGASPAGARAPVPASRYMSVTAGAVDYRPVEPKPWIERNERVAPHTGGE